MTPAIPTQVERLMAVLQQRGVGVHTSCRELSEAAGVVAGNVYALLRHNVDAGLVEIGGKPRRYTYALTGATAIPGRRMTCAACGEVGPRKGAVLVAGLGYCCVSCGTNPQRMAAGRAKKNQPQGRQIGDWLAPKRGERSPEGRPPAESKEPWKPYAVQRKPSEPAQPVQAVELPGVKVTVRETPLGRYEVPNSVPVIGGFASLGIGRYLDGGANA